MSGLARYPSFQQHNARHCGCSALSQWARNRGIDLKPAGQRGVIASVLPVAFMRGRFVFVEPFERDAEAALVVLMTGPDDIREIDLAACSLDDPATMGVHLGVGEMLGLSAALNPATYFAGRPLRLRRDPISWIADGARGACFLNAEADAYRLIPSLPGDVLAEDLAHAAHLVRLTYGFMPSQRVRVPRGHS